MRFTDGRVPASRIPPLFSDEHRWQRWLDVEVALAAAEADAGIVPATAARAIAEHADIHQLGAERIREGIQRTSHPIMALVSMLSDSVGEPHGGWVHWGATTQNITQTGDALVVREAHHVILDLLGETFAALESLAIAGKDMASAGRTHGQQAVPITFGFKAAGWIDEYARHVDRLRQAEPRIFTAMMGGAVGNFASLGDQGPIVQEKLADLLGLTPMAVPSRAASDMQAEYVCVLAMMAATTSKIAKEVYTLMQTEFDEVSEPIPKGTIGSSTMPHKRNPQLVDDCIAIAAQIRSLVPLALDGMLHDHEVCGANTQMTDEALKQACILTGDMLTRMVVVLSGLELHPEKMRANLSLTGGLLRSEAIMLALGESVGRQQAHDIVYEAAQVAAKGEQTFESTLHADPRVTRHLDRTTISHLLDPTTETGLSARLANEAAERAHKLVIELRQKTKPKSI